MIYISYYISYFFTIYKDVSFETAKYKIEHNRDYFRNPRHRLAKTERTIFPYKQLQKHLSFEEPLCLQHIYTASDETNFSKKNHQEQHPKAGRSFSLELLLDTKVEYLNNIQKKNRILKIKKYFRIRKRSQRIN